MSVITEFDGVENALYWVRFFRQQLTTDSLHMSVLSQVMQDDRLIEAVVLDNELWLIEDDFDATFTRNKILFRILGLEVDLKNALSVIRYTEVLTEIATYFDAIQYLVDYGFDEACLIEAQ